VKCYTHIQPIGINAPILVSQKGTIFTIQRNIEGSEEEISLEGEELKLSLSPQNIWLTGLQHE
jgi:hypothetical protein